MALVLLPSAGGMTKRMHLPKPMRRWALVGCVLLSMAAAGQPETRPSVQPRDGHGLFTGDQWRYRRADLFSGLVTRIFADLVAIPSGMPWWGAPEWAVFGGAVGSTAALSIGRPSLDVQFQGFVQNEVLGGPNHFTVWNTTGDLVIWSTTGAATVGLLIYGLITGHAAATETATLMIEAFAVAQLYHQMIKLLAGRAQPTRPELGGEYFGPARSLEFWPGGTPSGHMASMYALLSVLMTYFDHPVLWVALNAFALVFGAALVGDNYHWVSDVILGGAIGFSVGRWVVHHRSTRYRYGADRQPERVGFTLAPVVLPGSGAGLGVVLTF